jgi:hypothetical protein
MVSKRKATGRTLGKKLLRSKKLKKEALEGNSHPLFRLDESGLMCMEIMSYLQDKEVCSKIGTMGVPLQVADPFSGYQVAVLHSACRFFYHVSKDRIKYCGAVDLRHHKLGLVRSLDKNHKVVEAVVGPNHQDKRFKGITAWTLMGKGLGAGVKKLIVTNANEYHGSPFFETVGGYFTLLPKHESWVNAVLEHVTQVETLVINDFHHRVVVTPTHKTIKHIIFQGFIIAHGYCGCIRQMLVAFKDCPVETVELVKTAPSGGSWHWDISRIKRDWPLMRSFKVNGVDYFK